nr:LPD38 domain-containing protein [uncultured Porphyromonas sp.]
MEEKVKPQAKPQTPTNEGRKYVYDKLKEQGYNVGSYGEFDTAMSSDEDSRRWAYDELGKSGVDLGEYAEFEAGIGYAPAPKKPRQKHSIEEATTPKLGFPKLDSRMRMVDESNTPLLKTERYLTQVGVQEDGTPIYDTKQRAELVPDFDPQNGGVTAPPAYLDVRTGKTIKAKDKSPEVQRAKEEAKRKPEQITDVERTTRDSVARLDADIDSEMSQAMDRIAKENAEKAKDTKNLVGMGLAAAAGSMPGGAGMAVAANPFDPDRDAELSVLKEAKRRLKDARNIIAEADHNAQSGTLGKWLESSFAGGAARGFGQKLFDARTWDFGLGELAGNTVIKSTIDKADAGKSLTKAEMMLLDALSVEMATNAYFGSYVGRGYKAGGVTAESMPFMLEMALNPLSATGSSMASKLARYAIKRYGLKVAKGVGQKALRVGARVAGDVAGAVGMTLTTGVARTVGDAIDRMTGDVNFGLDDNGRVVYAGHEQGDDLGTALYKATASQSIENYSEMFGNYFGPLLGGAGRVLGKGASKVPYLRRATELLSKVNGSQLSHMVDDLMTKTQWQGMPAEYMEEVAGNAMNALLVGDKDFSTKKGKGVFNLDDNIDTFLGVSLMSGAISMAKTVGYRTPTMEARKSMERSEKKALSAFGDPVRWGGIRGAIESGDDTEVHNAVAGVLRDKTATEEQKKAVLDYARKAQTYLGMEEAKRNRLTQSSDDATAADVQASYENGYTLATPQQMSDAKNNLDYLAYKASSDLGVSRDDLSALSSEGNIDGAYVQGLRDRGYSDQQIGSVLDWLNARATYDGMIQHAKDDIADQTQAIRDDIDANTAKDGTLRGATIEDGEGEKRVYIVDGNVSMLEDGSGVDKANSDDNIIIRDPETGEVRFVHLSTIIRADEVRDPEVEKARLSDEAKESIAGRFADQIEGKLPLAVGDVYSFATEAGEPYQVSILQDNGDGTMQVEANGEQLQMSGEDLQAQADITNQVRVRQYHEEEAQRQAELLDQERADEGKQPYQLNDQIVVRTPDGGETIGYIQSEEDEDGRIEVWTDSPINGRRVQLFSRDELDGMIVQHNPAESTIVEASGVDGQIAEEVVPRDHVDMDAIPEEEVAPEEEIESMPEESGTEEVHPEPEVAPDQEDNTALGRIPLDENGEPSYESVPVSTSYDALLEQTDGDADMVDRVIDSVLSDKRAELKNVEASKVKHGSSVSDKIRAEREREARLEKARGDVAYWEQMKGEREERRIKESQNIDESARVEVGEAPEYHMDNGADARERGYVNVSGYRIDRQEPLSGALVGKEHSVKFATDVAPTAKYAVIDVRELQASHNSGVQNARHFIPEAQPKDRSGSVSVLRAESMARNIKPEEITGGATAYTGSPVVNSRGEVIQGNGRSDALRIMWSHNPDVSEEYKQYLIGHADKFGLDADAVRSMRSPVLVHMVDVDDSEAIRLGQYKMSDIETGGEERIDPSVTAQKMGSDIGVYASLLFASNEEGKSLSDLVSRNGVDVLQWMNRKGYISDNQYSSALNKQGALTAEAREDLKAILYQILFDGGHMSIKKDFDDLPKSAQNALLQTVHRAIGLPDQSGIITLLQKSIGAYAGLLQYETFRNAKSPEDVSIAVDQWAGMQDLFGDRSNGEIFGNFALKLAEAMRVSTQRKLASLLNELYDVVQGSGEDTLFEAAEATPKSLEEAIIQVFGLKYGDNGSVALADNSERGESGGSRGSGETPSGEHAEGEEGTTERGGGTEEPSEEVVEVTEEPTQNEVEGSEVSASEEVAEQPIDNTEVEEEAVPEEVETSPEGTVSEKEIVADDGGISNIETEEQSNGTEEVHVPASTSTGEREGGQEHRPSETLGEGSEHESTRTDDVGVDRRDEQHSTTDEGGSGGATSGTSEQGTAGVTSSETNWRDEFDTDSLPSSSIERARANIEAIRLSKEIENEGRGATLEEMKVLHRYSGWGGAWPTGAMLSQLESILTPEELSQAEMSRNSAYFTPSYVVDVMWDVARAVGFKGGRVLEGSAGIGNILGRMPSDLAGVSSIDAVEVDGATGRILSQLYPKADVHIDGFEHVSIPARSVDLAITNVPFVTGLRVYDDSGDIDLSKRFNNIHDFCIAKNVRKLKEGGVGVFISSSGTLDNSLELRKWLVSAKGGDSDVVGAFRLNNATFSGTMATSDIIVVRKRVGGIPSDHAIDVGDIVATREASYYGDGDKPKMLRMTYNRYFAEHPENMGGKMMFAFENGDTYRPETKSLYPDREISQPVRLSNWLDAVKAKDFSVPPSNAEAIGKDEAREAKKSPITSSVAKEGSIGVNENGEVTLIQYGLEEVIGDDKKVKGKSKAELVKSYLRIKDALSELLRYEEAESNDDGLSDRLLSLNEAYDSFVDTFGHLQNNRAISLLSKDVDFPSIQAIELYENIGDEKGERKDVYTKTDIFNKRVVSSPAIAKPQTIHEALAQSISGMSSVNVRFIAEGLGVSEDEARAQLLSEGLVFEDPITGDVVVHFEYTSGNVRDKLKQARANNSDGRYDSNISALEKVLPEDIPAHLIYLTLGSDFIPTELYSEFTKEKTGVSATFSHASGKWMMSINGGSMTEQNRSMGVRSLSTGVSRLGTDIILSAFTFKNKEFSKTSGKETITDKEATIAYAQKVEDIRAEFNDWMRSKMEADEELRDKIATAYNETVNSFVPMKIPDEYTTAKFQGATDSVTLNPHQAKAAIRATIEPVLLAHEVGTGKTFTLITSAMEMRRRGTAQKPLIVVQNATLGQFVASAKRLYPASKILMPTESGKEGRLRFFAQIKYNDWDMVIIPQSMLSFIPDSAERKSAFIQAKIEEKVHQLTAMREARADNRDISYVKREIDKLSSEIALISGKVDTKQLAKSKQNADVRAREMLERKTDETYNFDALGIDAILVDEAHEYKRLGFSTEFARGVKGVDTAYSAKSQGLYLKVKSVLERSGGRNVVFATGTPVSNTAAEVWTFMKYLMSPEDMRGYGIEYFDDFVRKFGDVRDMMEFTTAGKYKETRRFSGYKNLPELLRVWSQVADTVLSRDFEELNKEIPKMEGGGAKDVYLPQSPALRSIMKAVKSELERYDKMSGAEKKENAALPLRMYGIAKAGAIDPRLVLDSAPDDPNSKTNETVRAALRSLEESKSYKGAVAIFSDMFRNTRTGFNLHEEIARKLIDAGVPESQIAVIRSGMSTDKKLDIFSKVNRGEIRVVIGSTFTLGTGVNIQERLRTLIHIDAPNRPMDYTQRNGRILRQGNLHKVWDKPVEIIRFGVEDSLDVTAYQRLKTKGAIADSVMQGNSRLSNSMEGREIEEEEDSFGDMVANLSGSEYALLKNKAEKDLRKLVAKRSQWEADQRYISMELPKRKATLAVAQSMKAEVEAGEKVLAKAFPDGVITDIVVNGVHYASLEDLGDIVKKHNSSISEASDIVKQSVIDASQRRSLKIEINGVEFIIHTDIGKELRTVGSTIEIKSTRTMKYTAVALGLRDVPVQRGLLSNALKDIEENVVTGKFSGMLLSSASELITRTTKAIEQMESRASDTFAEEEELEQSKKRVEEYEALMQKELAVKEAKYAKIDAEVEGADILQMSAEEDTETSEEDDDLRYRYTEREDGTLLSENAFEAEELGKFPKAKFRKVYGVTPTDFEMLLAIGLIINSEWHHTGKTFRETKYYSWADNAELDNGHFGLQSTLPEGGDVYYSMDGRATTEDPYGLSKEDAEALPFADSSLSEWYKAHKKEIKKLADEYKRREWAWETLENVPYAQFSSEEDRTNTLKAEHFYGYEREANTLEEAFARKLYWDMIYDEKGRTDGEISQETKDEIRQKAVEEGRIQAQALMEENRERFDQAMEESQKEKEEAELRNAERMKRNLSEDSKAGILLQLAGMASLDREQTINKIEKFVERNSLDKSPDSSAQGYEYRSSNPNDVGNGEDSDLYDVASSLVRELGEKAYIVEELEELEDIDGLPAKAISSKGWYNTRTGEVVVVLPNHTDEEDVARTVLHEVVGHKGIRAVVGDRSFEVFLDKVYKGATPEVRRDIIERSKRYGWNVRVSTEEYIAELAERGFADREDQGMWNKIKEAFRDLISRIKLSLGFAIGDRELRYMLWRSWQMQQKGGIIGEAENISRQMELGVGNFGSEDNSRYRRGTYVPPTQGDGSLKESYDNLIASSRYQMAEAVQDSMKSVADVYKMILEKEGNPVDIEEVDGYENAYLGENRLSSVNQAEMEYFSHQVLKPFLDEVGRIVKSGSGYEEVTDYMMSLHGLERNRSMAFDRAVKALAKDQGDATLEDRIHREYLEDGDRIANEEAFEAKRISADAYHKEDDRIRKSYVGAPYDEYRQMDYAGLTGMDSVYEDVEDAEQGALDRIREFEKRHDVSLLWKTKRGVTDATRGKLYETGMISKETDAKLRDMYRYYIPLRGFADGTSEDHYGYLGEARGSFAPAMKRAKGRKSQADDPIAQMSKMFESAVVQGNRNKLVKQKMLNFVMNHPSELFSISDLWLHYNDVTEEWEPVYPEALPEGASHEEVEDHMREFEERMIAAKEAKPSEYKRGAEARSIPYRVLEGDLNEHQMIVKRGGRSIVVTINGNPRFAQAINGMSNPDSNMGGWVGAIFELGSKVNRVLSALYTTKNPDFLMSNIIRDMLYSNTMVWVKESPSYARRFHANIAKYNPVVLRRLLKKHKAGTLNLEDATERHFYQFMMNGGETGYTQQRDIEGHKNEIQRALVGSSGRLTAKKAFMLLGKLGDDLNRAVENVARFSAYVASRDEGRSIDRSIYDAKEISVNFNKKGAGSKFYNAYGQTFLGKSGALISGAGRSFYVFWNAAVQGLSNYGRSVGKHPYKGMIHAAGFFTLGVVIPLMAYMNGSGDGDDDYWDLPEYVRRSNICFNSGDGTWVTIPLPQEMRAVYGLGELAVSTISGKEHRDNMELTKAMVEQVTQVLPLDLMEGGGSLRALYPSFVKPLVEASDNVGWTGMPIYKDTPYNKSDPEWTKAYRSANSSLVWLSKTLNELTGGDDYKGGMIDFNPAQVEYILKGYFGGAWSFANKLAKSGETMVGDRSFEWNNIPLANRVIKTSDERTKFRNTNNEYYKYKKEAEEVKKLERKYEKSDNVLEYAKKIDELQRNIQYRRYLAFEDLNTEVELLQSALKVEDDPRKAEELTQALREAKKSLVDSIRNIK